MAPFTKVVREMARGPGSSLGLRAVLTAIPLPVGVMMLLSFGGQVRYGPILLILEWLLAYVAPRPLRIAWSVLAGALVGEIFYLVAWELAILPSGVWLGVASVAVATLVALLFMSTTDSTKRPTVDE